MGGSPNKVWKRAASTERDEATDVVCLATLLYAIGLVGGFGVAKHTTAA